MLERKLKHFGLTEKEISVYLCILQYQRILPSRVSEITSINRPTVYSVAKELIRKGLISEDATGPSKYLLSNGEDALNNISSQYERRALELKNSAPELIKELKLLPKQGKYSIPKMRLIDEWQLRDFLIERSAVWAESALARDNTWWGFQDHTLLEHYEEWADYFWKKFSKKIHLNLFTNKRPIETEKMVTKPYSVQRHVKYIEENSEFTATHVVIGDYILMIMTNEKPHYLIEIHDTLMAENVRAVFKRMWARQNF